MTSVTRLALLSLLVSCTSDYEGDGARRLIFRVESDPGVPLAGASLWLDGRPVPLNASGQPEVRVTTDTERVVHLRHDCPPGHVDPTEDRVLRIRRFQSVAGARARPLEVSVKCPLEEHIASFVVRTASAPPLPVKLDGVEVALTGPNGVAFFSRRAAAGTEFAVQLDTGEQKHLSPTSPSHVFVTRDQHQIFVIDQRFEIVSEPIRRRRRRQRITKIE